MLLRTLPKASCSLYFPLLTGNLRGERFARLHRLPAGHRRDQEQERQQAGDPIEAPLHCFLSKLANLLDLHGKLAQAGACQ